MFFDRPARFLYRHRLNLYMPMRVFATHYVQLCIGGVVLAVMWLAFEILSGRGLLTSLGILRH